MDLTAFAVQGFADLGWGGEDFVYDGSATEADVGEEAGATVRGKEFDWAVFACAVLAATSTFSAKSVSCSATDTNGFYSELHRLFDHNSVFVSNFSTDPDALQLVAIAKPKPARSNPPLTNFTVHTMIIVRSFASTGDERLIRCWQRTTAFACITYYIYIEGWLGNVFAFGVKEESGDVVFAAFAIYWVFGYFLSTDGISWWSC